MPKVNEDIKIRNINNKLLVDQFTLLVNQIKFDLTTQELTKKDKNKISFSLRHFRKIIGILKSYPDKITSGEDLKDVSGIGKGTIERIDEILKTKKLKEVDSSRISKITKKNNVVDDLSSVINIGPKVAAQLYEKHNLKNVADLKKKVESGNIKVNDKIKMGLKYHGKVKLKIPRTEMDIYNTELNKFALSIDKDLKLTVAGSYRREKKTSNDIDVLITHQKIKTDKEYEKSGINYLSKFVNFLKNKKIIVDDLTDTNNLTKYMGFSKLPKKSIRRIDIRFVPFNSYHSALLYFTGSYELNTQMRQIAKSLKYKLNEYGLFKIKDDGEVSARMIKVNSEKDIFKKLKLDYIEPSER